MIQSTFLSYLNPPRAPVFVA